MKRDALSPASLSTRLYRLLLTFYPRGFRHEYGSDMLQVFGDLCRDSLRQQGWVGLAKLWGTTLRDFAASAITEYYSEWRHFIMENSQNRLPAIIGGLLLLPPALFALLNILEYQLGVPVSWQPFAWLTADMANSVTDDVLDIAFVSLPLVALVVLALPMLHITLSRAEEGSGAWLTGHLTIQRTNRLSLALIGACLLVGFIFVAYFIGENWACLVGRAVAC